MVTRVAVAWVKGELLSLVSELSVHTQALRANPTLSLLMGEPGEKGDPLTYPRLTLFGTAQIVEHKTAAFAAMRAPYLREYPKAKLYIDFTDFVFLQVKPTAAHLNGGFGRAFHLTPEDLI